MPSILANINKVVFLIDGNAYIHRAFHAIPPLTISSGLPINAVYGFIRMILKLIKNYEPKYLGICFDSSKPTFRHKLFTEYKATRKKMDDDLQLQIPIIYEFVDAIKIKHITIDGYEADDVINVIAKKVSQQEFKVVIISGDKDILQSVNENIVVYNEHKNIWYNSEKVNEKYGISPVLLTDYFALLGDTSDNIPGVRGIGEKTALKLVKQFGSIENIYSNIDSVEQKLKEKLISGEQNAKKSKQLVTLLSEIDELKKFEIKDLSTEKYDKKSLIKLLNKYEMKSIISDLEKTNLSKIVVEDNELQLGLSFADIKKAYTPENLPYETVGAITQDFSVISTKDDVIKFETEIEKCQEIVGSIIFNTKNDILGFIGIAYQHNEEKIKFYVPQVKHKKLNNEVISILSQEEFISFVVKILCKKNIKYISHNVKTQIVILNNHNLTFALFRNRRGVEKINLFDTQIADHLLTPDKKNYSLQDSINIHLGEIPVTDFIFPNDIDISLFPLEKFGNRILHTVNIVYQLYKELEKKLEEKTLWELFTELELPLIPIIANMELNGILVDKEYLNNIKLEVEQKINDVKTKIYTVAETVLNLNSPKQLSFLLFEKLKLPATKKKKTGFSTDEEVLHSLYNLHPIVPLLLEHRELEKLKNTYIDPFFEYINPLTNRVHTTFNLTGTATGRLSSENPNLQNIPIRTEYGKKIRKMFVAQQGYNLVSFDYSQIELRILAHLSKDKTLTNAFLNDEDVHITTAMEIFNLKKEDINPAIRRIAKVINFGIIYGMSAQGLTKELNIDYKTAQEYIDKYFEKYSGVKEWINEIIKYAQTNFSVRTILNRYRPITEILSTNNTVRASAERLAVNTPIQGSAADIIKLAMVKIDNYLLKIFPKTSVENINNVRMLLQIHDELIFEIKEDILTQIVPQIKNIMETVLKLEVPLTVDVTVSTRWEK